ncbi:MerR family transcriptional regulator [Bacillus sp. FJAT-45350]|uniref:MerR family transcriptional regulator n=1 Tax=Bacillus sp. FJAT-45350 TaxID=2011014 RepID=UPI0015CD47AE|nr:MerR family transcriptional regulator [Bacillus sp. FJAT-45350]
MYKDIPRNIALFPISVVEEMTGLTARQIRYYEDQGLITPARNDGNQRIFSLQDIDCFAEIKSLIDQGVNIAGIKAVFESKEQKANIIPHVSEEEWKEMLKWIRSKLY